MATATAAGTAARPARPVYTRIGVLGLALVAGTGLLLIIVALATGEAGDGLVFAVPAAIAAGAAVLGWRYGTWSKVVGLVLSVLFGLAGFFFAFGPAYPASILDFVPGLALPLGVVLGISGNAAAIVQGRRGHREAAPTRGERAVVTSVLAALALAAVVSGALTVVSRSTVDPASTAGAAEVRMQDFEFSPATMALDADGRLYVHNADPFVHDLVVEELGVDVTLMPGSEEVVALAGATPGTYTVYCTLHADTGVADPEQAGMAATLTVR